MEPTEDARCPACGDPIDYCQGHGDSGDPLGAMILKQHDEGDHGACHENGCEESRLITMYDQMNEILWRVD